MERREFLAFAATLPLSIWYGLIPEVRLDHIQFIGSFGRQVEQELRFQLSKQRSLFGNLLNLTFSANKPDSAVVSEMSDPELSSFIKSMESNEEFRRSCVGYFAVNFRTGNASCEENIGRLFRLIHETFPHQRIFTDLDYQGPKALPQWPLEWKNNSLTLEQKQIVWELSRNGTQFAFDTRQW